MRTRLIAWGLGLLGAAALVGPATAQPDDPSVGDALGRTVRRLTERLAPSVVRLEVERTPAAAPSAPGHPALPPGAGGFPDGQTPSAYFRRPDGPTSAVVVDADGGLLTSYYNVQDRVKSITAVLADGRRLPAELVGADPNTDVAYLRIEATGLTPIVLSDREPTVGQLVAALGCAPGEPTAGAPTATVGIVSATRRLRDTAPPGERQGTAVQLTARLNYGNNGGPVVDMDGVCVALAAHCTHDPTNPNARKGFNSGVGFATAATRLRTLLPQLRAGVTLPPRESPFLGVGGLGPDPKGEGVRVGQIVPDTPAAKARLQVGDIIIMAGDTRVESGIDLRFAILERDVGDALDLVVLRGPDRTRVELTVTLGARPAQERR